ncbi:LLM class flavin-dependent oxidoreductase [bacterium]|nr:LLM class flavin-dependent oxidoreductase [bacterium]
MNTKQQIKHLLVINEMTMTELCRKMSEKLGKPYTIHNISGKLNRDTIKYSEIKLLYDILGYELVLRKK